MAFDRAPEVTDPKAMRALAHPVRIALLEALTIHGQLTATEAGEIVGESPANASFHLRQLAKYGYVEEAEGGTGRRRPWKRKHLGMSFSEVHDDPETAAAARELSRMWSHRYLARAEKGLEDNRLQSPEWRESLGWNQMGLYLTAAELDEMQSAIREVLFEKFGERRVRTEATPADAERVEILTFSYRV
jgi:DNA-binding transcriptional ArsR family regulator